MNFPDTVPGDRIQPESAARYNALNALLRASDCGSKLRPTAPCRYGLTVDVYNISADPIAAFCAVQFDGTVHRNYPATSQLPGFDVVPAESPNLPWGIATGDIAPGTWGTAFISGAAPAFFAHTSAGKAQDFEIGTKLVPSPTGLSPRGDCGAIILCPEEQTDAETISPGVILLDGITTAYTGAFAVTCLSFAERKYSIAAGSTVFPGLEQLPETEVTFSSLNGSIWLVISYTFNADGNPEYTAEYIADTSIDETDSFAFELAKIGTHGAITQVWRHEKISVPGWVL